MIQFVRHLSIIIILALILSGSGVFAENQKLQLEINLDKETFLLQEAIWLDVIFTNISSDTIRFWGLFPPNQGTFYIEVMDSLNNILQYSGASYDYVRGDGYLLNANEYYYGCYDLLDLFAFERISFQFGLIPPGKYRVRARYQNLSSQEIYFNIVEPTGKEKDLYEKLLQAYKIKDKSLSRDIIENNNKSVYAESSFRNLSAWDEILKYFPNSGYSAISLKNITRHLESKEKLEYLLNVIKKFPKTRASKFAEQMLRIQKKESEKNNSEQ